MFIAADDDPAISDYRAFNEFIVVRVFAGRNINALGIHELGINRNLSDNRQYINGIEFYGDFFGDTLIFIKDLPGKQYLKSFIGPRLEDF